MFCCPDMQYASHQPCVSCSAYCMSVCRTLHRHSSSVPSRPMPRSMRRFVVAASEQIGSLSLARTPQGVSGPQHPDSGRDGCAVRGHDGADRLQEHRGRAGFGYGGNAGAEVHGPRAHSAPDYGRYAFGVRISAQAAVHDGSGCSLQFHVEDDAVRPQRLGESVSLLPVPGHADFEIMRL